MDTDPPVDEPAGSTPVPPPPQGTQPALAYKAPQAPIQTASPTIAEPSFDPAKEFLVLLLSPSTPFLKRRELMMK